MTKKKVLFVGSFLEKGRDGSVGGQMFACRSLIYSSLSDSIDWILLDTTGISVPPPSIFKRGFFAVKRILNLIFLILTKWPTSILIFSGSGASFFEKGLMAILGKIMGRKVVFAPRGGGMVLETQQYFLFKYYISLVFTFCDKIICQGKSWEAFFKKLHNSKKPGKFIVVPNWIETINYGIESSNESNEINIIFMGWMEKEKGVQDLFDALVTLQNLNKNINVYFLGDGSIRQSLIEKSKNIHNAMNLHFFFPGWVYGNDKLSYLAKADIFVLPSYFEGMPNSLMEAMSFKVACISTEVGAVSELICNNYNGLLFKPGDVDLLAKNLQLLIEDNSLRREFGIKAYQTIIENHSIDKAIIKLEKIL